MIIPEGYHDIPPGHLANVATYLEMRQAAPLRPEPLQPGLLLERLTKPRTDEFRALFRAVGEDFIWSSRLEMPEDELAALIANPDLHVYAAVADGRRVGLLELDFRQMPECELSFFGLAPSHVGNGAGRWLMNRAITLAFEKPITRFFVHTCTLDHPAALAFYIRSGFTPYKRQVEVMADPRLTGILPRTAAPQVPLIEG